MKCHKCNVKYISNETVVQLPNRFESFLYDYEKGEFNCETCPFETEATECVMVKKVSECKDNEKHCEMIGIKCCNSCKKKILLNNECVHETNYYNMLLSLTYPEHDYKSETDGSDNDSEYDDDYEYSSDEYTDEENDI